MPIRASSFLSIILIAALCLLVAAIAATVALAKPKVSNLGTDLASALRADYSVDPSGARIAPVGEGVIEVARQDENRLRVPDSGGTSGLEIVPVAHVDETPRGGAPGISPPQAPTPTAAPAPTATSASRAAATACSASPRPKPPAASTPAPPPLPSSPNCRT